MLEWYLNEQRSRQSDRLREAQYEQLARLAASARERRASFSDKALAQIGRGLVSLGMRLQADHGR